MRSIHLACALATFSFTANTYGEVTWEGDFETGDLTQWSYLLNEEGLSVVTDPVQSGVSAGKIEIGSENLWSNGLNRVEFQRKPRAELIAEGGAVYFGWSIYLPEILSVDDHQIGYWETDVTYQQVMSLHARGADLSFNTNSPYQVHWEGNGLLTAGQWHRIVYHVAWSADAAGGHVSLWFDGEKVVDEASAATYRGNPAFIQLGILRDTIDQVETMYVDDALEGTTFEDVALSDLFPPVESDGSDFTPEPSQGAAGNSGSSPAQPSSGPSVPSGAPSQPMQGGSANADEKKSSSSCALVPHDENPTPVAWLASALLALGLRRRGTAD